MSLVRLGKFLPHSLTLTFLGVITLVAVAFPEPTYACPAVPTAPTANPVSVPTMDLGVLSVTTQTAIQTGGVYTKECMLNALVKALSRAVIHELTTSVINWINNGFEGGPTFVTNPGGFFADIADQELGRMIDGSALGFLCDPFRFDIQLGFLSQRARYRTPSRCTITGIIRNVQGFTDGDFKQGGWSGWFTMSSIPVNNPYGSKFLSEELFMTRVTARQNTANITLGWGSGFNSIRDKEGNIITPGTYIDSQLKNSGSEYWQSLELGREFDDIVIALANAGLTRIMGNGIRR